jgi:hypothetical protein
LSAMLPCRTCRPWWISNARPSRCRSSTVANACRVGMAHDEDQVRCFSRLQYSSAYAMLSRKHAALQQDLHSTPCLGPEVDCSKA